MNILSFGKTIAGVTVLYKLFWLSYLGELMQCHFRDNMVCIEINYDDNTATYNYSGEGFTLKVDGKDVTIVSEENSAAQKFLKVLLEAYGGTIIYSDGEEEQYERDLSNRLDLYIGNCYKFDTKVEIYVTSKQYDILDIIKLCEFGKFKEQGDDWGCNSIFELTPVNKLNITTNNFTDKEIKQIYDFLLVKKLEFTCGACL